VRLNVKSARVRIQRMHTRGYDPAGWVATEDAASHPDIRVSGARRTFFR